MTNRNIHNFTQDDKLVHLKDPSANRKVKGTVLCRINEIKHKGIMKISSIDLVPEEESAEIQFFSPQIHPKPTTQPITNNTQRLKNKHTQNYFTNPIQ